MPATLTLGALRSLVREAERREDVVRRLEANEPPQERTEQHATWARRLAQSRARAEELNNTLVN